MRRVGLVVLLLIAAGLALAGYAYGISWNGKGPLTAPAIVTVPEGATLRSMAKRLQDAKAIGSSEAFLLGARLFGSKEGIRAGEYQVPAGASNAEILALLQSGKTIQQLITIPEGMPSILVYERLMANKDLDGPINIPPEGSVLPDSYSYERGERRVAVLARMQAAMSKFLAEQWPKREKGLLVQNVNEALSLASIVEKETSIAKERPVVAGVYYNRLRDGMRLQADPTIIYPITKGKPLGRRIRQSEIAAVNGYNTYSMVGLPVGPIANPGRSSIQAVLQPETTKALYFVADGQGGHIFAETYAEHQANVRKWFEIRKQRGEM